MNEAARRPVPDSYSALFPGRFLKADMFKGKKVTLTIRAIFGEDLTDADEQSKPEWIVQFEEKKFEWVMNKSNAYCLYRIFGGNPQSWIGHKITLFPQPGTWFGEKGEAIRVWGSPELTEDLPITLKFLRKKKDRNMVMHRVVSGPQPVEKPSTESSKPAVPVTERDVQIFLLLGWNTDVQNKWLEANRDLDPLQRTSKLEALLDQE